MRRPAQLKEVTAISAVAVILPPIGLCAGVMAALGNGERWYTLYPFATLAVISLLFGIYFIPKVIKLNQVICSQSKADSQKGKIEIRGLLMDSIVVGILLGTAEWDYGYRWGFGLIAGIFLSALLARAGRLREFWNKILSTQDSELTAI